MTVSSAEKLQRPLAFFNCSPEVVKLAPIPVIPNSEFHEMLTDARGTSSRLYVLKRRRQYQADIGAFVDQIKTLHGAVASHCAEILQGDRVQHPDEDNTLRDIGQKIYDAECLLGLHHGQTPSFSRPVRYNQARYGTSLALKHLASLLYVPRASRSRKG